MSFHSDKEGGHAKYVTMWIALTPVTPENSCLYVIPRQFDPGYINGDLDEEEEEEKYHNDSSTNHQQSTTLDPLQ
jgi:ectoine hydroxylase-related dioxygenase (phytanoyl-CoA dioxygenase family)